MGHPAPPRRVVLQVTPVTDDNPAMRISLGTLLGSLVLGAAVGCAPQPAPTSPPPSTGAPATAAPTTAAPTTVAPTTTIAVVTSTTTPGPHAPVISAFAPGRASGSSPLTTDLAWSISDPDGGALTCRLDLDGNGSYEVTITSCPTYGSRTRTYTATGTTAASIRVSDGLLTTTASTVVTVGQPTADQYDIALRMGGTMTPGETAAFNAAAAKWEGIVKTGEPDRPVNLGADACASGTAPYSGTVDDLLIDAQIVNIDGPGGVLGQAGPCLVRSSDGLPIYGIMQFDAADAASLEASGQLTDTIVHEMGHILGIGTIWANKGVVTGAGGANPVYTGRAALGQWQELGGTGLIPVENSGGAGTADSHWRETTFRTELMTGYLNGTNQLSAMSAASLADLGYGIDLAGADTYVLPPQASMRAASVQAQGAIEPGHMLTLHPTGSV